MHPLGPDSETAVPAIVCQSVDQSARVASTRPQRPHDPKHLRTLLAALSVGYVSPTRPMGPLTLPDQHQAALGGLQLAVLTELPSCCNCRASALSKDPFCRPSDAARRKL